MNSNVKQLRSNLKEILEGLQKHHRASTLFTDIQPCGEKVAQKKEE